MAEESGDGEKAKGIQEELNTLEERAEALDRQRTKNISAIRSVGCWDPHLERDCKQVCKVTKKYSL